MNNVSQEHRTTFQWLLENNSSVIVLQILDIVYQDSDRQGFLRILKEFAEINPTMMRDYVVSHLMQNPLEYYLSKEQLPNCGRCGDLIKCHHASNVPYSTKTASKVEEPPEYDSENNEDPYVIDNCDMCNVTTLCSYCNSWSCADCGVNACDTHRTHRGYCISCINR